MRKSIKAIICAASAAVMCAAPTVATFAGVTANTAITAEAAANNVADVINKDGTNYAILNNLAYTFDTKSKEAVLNGRYGYRTEITAPATIIINKTEYKITGVNGQAFENAPSITKVDLSNCTYLTTIGNCAFYKDTKLKEVKLPKSITTIGSNAFQESGVANINLSACTNLTSIGSYAFKKTALTSVTIPSSVTKIYDGAFNYCKSLRTLTIKNASEENGSKLTEIGQGAFEGTSITKLEIPSSVKSILGGAFAKCDNLNTVTFYGPTDEKLTIRDFAFAKSNGVNKPLTIYNYRGDNIDIRYHVFGYSDSSNKIKKSYGYTEKFKKYEK